MQCHSEYCSQLNFTTIKWGGRARTVILLFLLNKKVEAVLVTSVETAVASAGIEFFAQSLQPVSTFLTGLPISGSESWQV